MDFEEAVKSATQLFVRQRRELGEVLGFETRNKYLIETADKLQIGFCAEQQKGMLGFLLRQVLGHWRPFDLHFFDLNRVPVLKAVHPFRFYFQRLDISGRNGEPLGSIQHRFSLLYKKLDVVEPSGAVLMTVQSPVWKIWTFPFTKNGREVACVRKKWGGTLKESFLDADSFGIEFSDPDLTLNEKKLIVAASVFIDLQYFERKAR